jgi:hypothetical protein
VRSLRRRLLKAVENIRDVLLDDGVERLFSELEMSPQRSLKLMVGTGLQFLSVDFKKLI